MASATHLSRAISGSGQRPFLLCSPLLSSTVTARLAALWGRRQEESSEGSEQETSPSRGQFPSPQRALLSSGALGRHCGGGQACGGHVQVGKCSPCSAKPGCLGDRKEEKKEKNPQAGQLISPKMHLDQGKGSSTPNPHFISRTRCRGSVATLPCPSLNRLLLGLPSPVPLL